MFRRFASLFVCAAVGVAMLCMRPTAALAGGLEVDFALHGTREISSDYPSYSEMLSSLPTTQTNITSYGVECSGGSIDIFEGYSASSTGSASEYNYGQSNYGSMKVGSREYDVIWLDDWDGNSQTSQQASYGRMNVTLILQSSNGFPAGKYMIARPRSVERVWQGIGRENVRYVKDYDVTHNETWTEYYSITTNSNGSVGGSSRETGSTTDSGYGSIYSYTHTPQETKFQSATVYRSIVAWWDGSAWHEFDFDENGFAVLPQRSLYFAYVCVTGPRDWRYDTTAAGDAFAVDCLPVFSVGGLFESQQIVNVLNGDNGSTVTGTIDNQTSALLDTSGSDGIVNGATAGGVSSFVARLGFIGQIPQVVSSFLAPIGSASASDGLFFPGVTVLGYELIPAQMVPVWQNGLGDLETPIKAFNTGVLAVLFVKGAKHVFHKDLLGWDDEDGESE